MNTILPIAEHLRQKNTLESRAHHIFILFQKEGAFDLYRDTEVYFDEFGEDSPESPWDPVEGYVFLIGHYWAGDCHEALHIAAPYEWIDNPNDEVVTNAAKEIVANREALRIANKKRADAAKIEEDKAQLVELQKLYPDMKS